MATVTSANKKEHDEVIDSQIYHGGESDNEAEHE